MEQKKRVLFTKEFPESLKKYLADEGFLFDDIPFITIEYRDLDFGKIDIAVKRSSAIIFTSSHALLGLSEYLSQREEPLDKMVYAVGPKTADVVEGLICNPVVSDTPGSKGLIEEIERVGVLFPSLYVCGDRRLDTVPNYFKDKSVELNEIITYNTVLSPPDIDITEYCGVAFYSPSGVDSFLSKYSVDSDMKLFAIGETTANRLREHNLTPLVAEEPDTYSLVEQVINSTL